ncbi:MAG: GatB/YqeY domain-containing protein [Bilophila sp.]
MSLTERIEQDYIVAYKAKDSLRLGVLRLLKTAAKNLQVELRRPITDEELATVIQKQGKQRQDSIEQFTAANRTDLADKEAAELGILKEYLPEPLSPAELEAAVVAAVAEVGATGAAPGMASMGKVIQSVMAQYKGRVDGKAVSTAVKAHLAG